MASFRDRIVFITGASSGIGEELAREVVRRGGKVGLLARREEKLQELSDELEQIRGGCSAWAAADVTDEDGFAKALDHLEAELGGVDIVVANAGYGRPEPPHKFRPGSAIHMYDTNVFGMLRLFDWVLPKMLERESGQIVGVASLASYIGLTNSASYSGSKAAMRVHLQSLRVSLKPYGIEVTTICPGFVESELTDQAKFKMPFMWPTDRAVRYISDAIEEGRGEVMFPWQMAWWLRIMYRVLPTRVTEFILERGRPKKKPYAPNSD